MFHGIVPCEGGAEPELLLPHSLVVGTKAAVECIVLSLSKIGESSR